MGCNKKIKSISRQIIENAKGIERGVFDMRPCAAEHRCPADFFPGGGTMKRRLLGWGAGLTALAAAFGVWQAQMGDAMGQADRGERERYSVDPFWPQALPHQWQIGQVPGIAVDKDDNIW